MCKKKYELILFDLDGTLLDTSLGIFNSVRYAEKEMNFLPIQEETLSEFVGPPPKMMYAQIYGIDEHTAYLAAQKHREYAKKNAIYEASVYPEIEKLLEILKRSDYKLGVCTLKSQYIAEKILDNFKLLSYFDVVVGMDEKESFTKSFTIRMARKITNTTGKVLLVGDSQYDYEGALSENIDFVGVVYGFGFNEEEKYMFETIRNPLGLLNILIDEKC